MSEREKQIAENLVDAFAKLPDSKKEFLLDNASMETCGAIFADPARKVSSNYGIGSDRRIALYVDEANRSWCTSNADNDHRAITIEVANNGGAPDWPVSAKAYESLIQLLADICRRNPGIGRLRWKGDKHLVGQASSRI